MDVINENLRNNGNITLIRNTIPTADRLPNLSINPAYFIVMNDERSDGSTGLIAYPVNCEDSEADNLLTAFGLSKSTASKTSFGLGDLKTRFEADKQPVLKCSAIRTAAEQRQVSAVFRLQNKEGQTAPQNPSYYLKFKDFPDQIFQVGCLDILNSFAAGNGESVNFAEKAIPLADARALYYLDRDVLEAQAGAEVRGDKGIRRLSCRASATALPQPAFLNMQNPAAEYPQENRLLHVETAEDSYYVYAWKGGSRRVECPGASETDLLEAFNFTVDDTVATALPTDAVILAADEQEPLRCVSPLFPANFSVGFRTVDTLPEQHAFKSVRESSDLFTFGCTSAEKFFVGDTISKDAMIPVAAQSLDFLLSHPNFSKPTQNVERVHVTCARALPGPKRTAIQNAFMRVFGVPSAPQVIESHEAKITAIQIRSEEEIVNYFVNGMAFTPYEVGVITVRAFQTAKGRDPTAAEKTLIADLILNQRKIRAHYGELVVLLTYYYNESTMQGNWHCISCNSDPSILNIEAVQLAFLQVFGVPANASWISGSADEIKTRLPSFSPRDLVNYYVNGMANSEYEAQKITERAFQTSIYRAPRADEITLFQNLILKEKKLRPNYAELGAYLRSIPSPTETILQSGKTYRFILASNGRCLDIPNSSAENGILPQQWYCNGTAAQDFLIQSVGSGYYSISHKTNGKCLEIVDSLVLDGTKLRQSTCTGGLNQKFFVERAEDGNIRFKAAHSALCLETMTANADNGVTLQQSVCRAGQNNQIWIPYMKDEGAAALQDGSTYSFISKESTRCLDIASESKEDGAVLWQWTCNGTNAQHFRTKKESDGSFQLINISSNKCLSVTDSSTSLSAKLEQRECIAGRTSQRFLVEKTASGDLILKAAHTGQCLEIQTLAQDNGIRIQQFTCKAGARHQLWVPFLR